MTDNWKPATTTTGTYFTPKDCHKGNTALWTHKTGASLFIGGWNNGATFDSNTHVIDLTGTEHKYWDVPFAYAEESKRFLPFVGAGYKGWLSLPFPDFKTPPSIRSYEQWYGIAETIRTILSEGTDVLVACHGGHGRSGLFCSIVAYILSGGSAAWASPVDNLRKIHCDEAVETIDQEQFVYDVLGLNIKITRTFTKTAFPATSTKKYGICPICGTQSMFVDDFGMCLGCQSKYRDLAPTRADLTISDIEHKGLVDHSCQREKCVGIWTASGCKHVVHDQIIYEGLCQTCWDQKQDETAYIDDHEEQIEGGSVLQDCAVCSVSSLYVTRFGLCYDCTEGLQFANVVDYVHNSITDPYKSIPHTCKDVACTGIIRADGCGHIVHNLEVIDGKCPDCRLNDNLYKNRSKE